MSEAENPTPSDPRRGNLMKYPAPYVEPLTLKGHIARCLLAGLVAALPVAGLILLIMLLDSYLRVVVRGSPFATLDFPGVGLFAGFVCIYALGLTLTTLAGRFLWSGLDHALSGVPGVGPVFKTFKQVLGYGKNEGALFRQVVLVPCGGVLGKGPYEMGFVTAEVQFEGRERWTVFVPNSPNPMQGRLLIVEPSECLPTKIQVDVALKALFSTGKTGL